MNSENQLHTSTVQAEQWPPAKFVEASRGTFRRAVGAVVPVEILAIGGEHRGMKAIREFRRDKYLCSLIEDATPLAAKHFGLSSIQDVKIVTLRHPDNLFVCVAVRVIDRTCGHVDWLRSVRRGLLSGGARERFGNRGRSVAGSCRALLLAERYVWLLAEPDDDLSHA